MPPTVILIRHAQALHNVDNKLTPIPPSQGRDPELSALGREQCAELTKSLQEKLPAGLDISLIICSAMRRTCETAILSLGWLIAKGVPIQAHAGWQENSEKDCDTGSELKAVSDEFPLIDFSHVDPVYPHKHNDKYRYRKANLLARAQSVLEELYHRPEKAILVVSHSAFMRQCVTGDHFFNADYRIYDFEERTEGEAGPFQLEQWELTKGMGGMGRSYDEAVPLGTGLPEDELAPGEEMPLPEGVKPN